MELVEAVENCIFNCRIVNLYYKSSNNVLRATLVYPVDEKEPFFTISKWKGHKFFSVSYEYNSERAFFDFIEEIPVDEKLLLEGVSSGMRIYYPENKEPVISIVRKHAEMPVFSTLDIPFTAPGQGEVLDPNYNIYQIDWSEVVGDYAHQLSYEDFASIGEAKENLKEWLDV